MSQDLKNTLNLPQTGFPMRGNLVQREPVRIDHWEKLNLYEKIQSKNAAGPSFILHDGPPFTMRLAPRPRPQQDVEGHHFTL